MRLDGTSSRTGGSSAGGGRGLSAVVGVVLLVVIVVLGSVIAAIVGTAALGDTRKSVEVTRAEGAMSELDARIADTALGSDGVASRAVEFGHTGPDGYLTVSRDSWIQVSVTDAETGVESANVTRATLGTVTYAHGETTVAYEGGGVWRGDGANTTMVSPPEFHFRNTTLTLPVVTVDGDGELRERLQVVRAGPPERKYPNTSAGWINRVENSKVLITVHSDYYVAWGQYFEDTTDGIVTYDHGAKTASVKFLSLPREVSLGAGILATSGTGDLRLEGNGAYADSYNSSVGPYTTSSGWNGDVYAVGNVLMFGGSEIRGDVFSGDQVELIGTAELNGNLHNTTYYSIGGSATLNGTQHHIPGIASIEPIDRFVAQTVDATRTANDNDNTSGVITDRELSLAANSGTLTAGTYYLDHLSLVGDDLTLDTTGGDITIAVRDYVLLDKRSSIDIVGDGTVIVYLQGAAPLSGTYHFQVTQKSEIVVPDEIASQFRVYGSSHLQMQLKGDNNPNQNVTFMGVIYAPGGTDGTGSVNIRQANLYGAVVTGSLTLDQNGAIHYDEALQSVLIPRSPTVSRLEYMHVAVHEVDVTNR